MTPRLWRPRLPLTCAEKFADLKLRVINVVDLMRFQSDTEHPHGLTDREFDALFTVDKPVIFAYHGYPSLIHELTYRRTNHRNIHVRGYKEEGTTTTPFDMVMMNDLDRSTSSRTSSTGSTHWAAERASFASRCPMLDLLRGPIPASTARTIRPSPAGPGRPGTEPCGCWSSTPDPRA
ncbi:MAG: hypothetical protein ACR2JG_13890 [Geodermatophilaceae bacterium]